MRPTCLIYLSTGTGVRTGCHYLISLSVRLSVCVTFVVFTGDNSCASPISANLGSMETREYGLTRGTVSYTHLRAHETIEDLVCRLEVAAVAGLLWNLWCVLGAARFRVFHEFAFSNS